MPNSLLLGAYQQANTGDPEELRGSFERFYGRPLMDFPSRDRTFRAIINHCKMERIELNYGTYAGRLEFTFPASDFVSQIFPIRGKGEATIEGHSVCTDRTNSVLVAADAPLNIRSDLDYERLIVCIRSNALSESLAALTGRDIDAPIRPAPSQSVMELSGRLLREHALFLAAQLSRPGAVHPVVVKEFESALIAMFLRVNHHSYSHLLQVEEPAADSSAVRRAEDFIRANTDQPITVETLANVTGVGVLSLLRAFKRRRGYSPRGLLRRLRARNAGHDRRAH